MKILYFVYEFPPMCFGGLGTYALETSKKYVELGHEVTVVTTNWDNKLKPREMWEGVEVLRPVCGDMSDALVLFAAEEFHGWGGFLGYLGSILGYNIVGAADILRSGKKYDVVIGHDWLGVVGASIIKKSLGAKMFLQYHSTEQGRQGGGGSRTIKHMEKHGSEIADGLITVSWAMRDELIAQCIPAERIAVSWNGVDPMKYDPAKVSEKERRALRAKYGIPPGAPLVLFVGRLTEVKGAWRLARAVPAVLNEHPDARFILLGKGEQEQMIRDIIAEQGVGGSVTLVPEFVEEEERIRFYASCDIAVFPSLYEPFGIVSLEAMSLEKPVVVGAKGTSGFREQVITEGPGMCGVHVNPFEPADIAWGINLLLRSDRARIGQSARARVLQEFTWDRIAVRTLDIYNGKTVGK
jgi:glycogen synthase